MEGIGEDPITEEDMRFLGYIVGWIGGHRQFLGNVLWVSAEKRRKMR